MIDSHLTILTCTPAAEPPAATNSVTAIDERSYQLGVIGGFAEVVGVGVKKLALSSAMSPDDMAGLREARGVTQKRKSLVNLTAKVRFNSIGKPSRPVSRPSL